MMNARKIAWQMLHAELRRRIGPAHTGQSLHPELETFRVLRSKAADDGVRDSDIMLELAGFAATFAQMSRNDPLGVAAYVELSVMSESDDG